jgi:ABC-type ATPase involved in cell division
MAEESAHAVTVENGPTRRAEAKDEASLRDGHEQRRTTARATVHQPRLMLDAGRAGRGSLSRAGS